MRTLKDIRASKPPAYPDNAIYAEYACIHFGLSFQDLDGGTGLVFRVASPSATLSFGGGRCSVFPQNNAAAATLAADKYFTQQILADQGIPCLAGEYFFLHDRHRAHRPPGHERNDALAYFEALNSTAFVKPLHGSRGDFARPVAGRDDLAAHLDAIAQFYDSVLIQPIVRGDEYRFFLLDHEPLYTVRKEPPCLIGDGRRNLPELLAEHNRELYARGLSPTDIAPDSRAACHVPAAGERIPLRGRMNRSAGGAMTFAAPARAQAALALARRASHALGLRAAAVDLFTDIDGDPEAMAVIEVNANPSIRFLEDSGRADLILAIWRHTFTAMGLLRV